MWELVGKYKNVSSLMCTLEKENANNLNTGLLQVRQYMEINTYKYCLYKGLRNGKIDVKLYPAH